ncbi:hypothetical protein E2K98_27760 [Bacillus salipaludis]|uniref:Uncharacterized protein n=1 Tax=Bacillus salipaludis TaxID=2547811 RepID=A0A4R5VIC0_9BACI|nr:hypothetical protein [Bacillus salipaludis]MDQ6600564.1 hypothetical protein [Bacillus salipaludis]TDK55965.1 hypothetical protein E2K98_27760 [Bacillus salipaludis]
MYRRSAQFRRIVVGALLVVGVFVVFQVIRWSFSSEDSQVKGVVEDFYHYEQDSDFAGSWGLFHSSMKEKFNKSNYIQTRAHVFMNDFGVDTFTYKVGSPEELGKWQMSQKGPSFQHVYKVPVVQSFKGKFGNFDIHQNVFVLKEKGEWRIVWDYAK